MTRTTPANTPMTSQAASVARRAFPCDSAGSAGGSARGGRGRAGCWRDPPCLCRTPMAPLLRRRGEFVRQLVHVVDVPERLHDRTRVHRHAARLRVGVAELPGERLDVAVEHQADVVAV